MFRVNARVPLATSVCLDRCMYLLYEMGAQAQQNSCSSTLEDTATTQSNGSPSSWKDVMDGKFGISPQKNYKPQVESQNAKPQVESQNAKPQDESQKAKPQIESQKAKPQIESQKAEPQIKSQKAKPQIESQPESHSDTINALNELGDELAAGNAAIQWSLALPICPRPCATDVFPDCSMMFCDVGVVL